MKVNRQSYSNCRSLPPNVEGELNGALTMQIDEIVWCKKSVTDVIVYVQWWGEQESKIFRPLNSKPNAHRGLPTVFTYRIYTARQLFYTYLEDSRHLPLVVADAHTYRPLGHATLSSLRESLTEQSAKQFCLPVVNSHGLKVAELFLSFSLKFFKNIGFSKTLPADVDAAETFPVQKTVRSIQTRGVPDSLVVQLLEQARRLRDAMAKSVLEDWEETEVRQFCSECQHPTAPYGEKFLSCLLDVEEETVQQEAVEALNNICPSAELLDLIASLGKPAEEGELGSKQQEKCELPKDGKDSKEVIEGSLTNSPPHGEHHVVADSFEFLKLAVSMRVCISSLYLQSIPRTNGTYFVDYEVPQGLVTGNAPLSRSTCSRRLAGRVVQFGQKFVHTLSQQGASLAASLRDAHVLFRVYCRQLSERKRSLLGQVSMSLAELAGLAGAERLEVQQDLVVRGVGKLRVVVQLGCDKVQYGLHVLVEEKERLQSGWTSSKDHLQPSAPTEKLSFQAVSEESGWQSATTIQQDPVSDTQQQLLYALLRISYGRLETSCSSYIVCRAFWKDHVVTSNIASDSCNPRYDLHQVLPLLLSQKLLQRCHKNVLVMEVWKKMAGCIKHVPLGLAKLPLHPFYLAYKDPIMVSQLLLAKYPVVSVDGWVPVVCPGRGVCGELKVFLALGTEEQVRSLCGASWTSLGPGGDADNLPPELPGVNRGILPLQSDTIGMGRTLSSGQREGGARSDTCQDSVPQNTAKTKDVRPPRNKKAESSDIQVNPEGCIRHHGESRKSVNFNMFCQSEAWLGKVQTNNQSRGLCSCYCTRKYDEFPSVEVKLRETVSKLCDGLGTSEKVAAVHKDVGMRECGKMAYVTRDEIRERSVVHGAEEFNCDLGCLSGFSSDDEEPINFLRKEKELPVKDGAGSMKDQDTAPSGPERFLEDTDELFSRLQRNLMKINPDKSDNLQMPSLLDFGEPGSMRDRVFESECKEKATQYLQRKGNTEACHSDTNKLLPDTLRHLMEANPAEADTLQMPIFFHLGKPSCVKDRVFESECQKEEMQHLQRRGNTEAGNSDSHPHLTFLQGNLKKLNVAGGDASQTPNLLDYGEQGCMKDHVLESECEEEMQRLQRKENREAEHNLKNYLSSGQFVGIGKANVRSYSGFTGEVTSEATCTDLVTVSCNTESKTVSEEATVLVSDSASVECAEAFSVRVKVEQAMHLKLLFPWCNDEPKVYVTFLANSSRLQQLVSPTGKASEGPVWAWSCDTELAVDLLTNEEKRLVMKVWQMAGDSVNAAADAVLGFAVVDLTSLMHGSSFLSGWYSLVDYAGCCTGQIKVTVVPLEDLSRFIDHTPEAEKPFQDNLGLSESDLYSNLKDKLCELDEITARLRQRLGSVVSSPATNALTQVGRQENAVDPASHGEHMPQDKCIQTHMREEDPGAWTDWLMGVGMRDLELENVFNPLLFQPILSSCVEQMGSQQPAELCGGQLASRPTAEATEQMAGSGGSSSRPHTVAERLQMLWSSSDILVHGAQRQAPDGISLGGNSTSVSQLSVCEETKKTSKT